MMKKPSPASVGKRSNGPALPPGYRQRKITRSVNIGNISLGTIDQGQAYKMSLSDIPQYTEIVDSWDLWRIDSIEYHFTITRIETSPNATCNTLLLTAPDYTDTSAPATESEILVKEQLSTDLLGLGRPVVHRVIYPRANQATYQGITTGYSLAGPGVWMATANPGINYYGLKVWLSNYNSTFTPYAIVNVRATVHLSVAGSQ
jgi:hypothetical protein